MKYGKFDVVVEELQGNFHYDENEGKDVYVVPTEVTVTDEKGLTLTFKNAYPNTLYAVFSDNMQDVWEELLLDSESLTDFVKELERESLDVLVYKEDVLYGALGQLFYLDTYFKENSEELGLDFNSVFELNDFNTCFFVMSEDKLKVLDQDKYELFLNDRLTF